MGECCYVVKLIYMLLRSILHYVLSLYRKQSCMLKPNTHFARNQLEIGRSNCLQLLATKV